MIVSLDPGKTTGYVVWEIIEKKATPTKVGTLQYGEELFSYLFKKVLGISLFIIEDYKVRPPKEAHKFMHLWLTPVSVKIIGILEYLADIYNIEIVKQQPAVMTLGYNLLGTKRSKTKNKQQHIQDALAHGSYYFHRQGIFIPNKN